MSGFTKLWSEITDSSIWNEDDKTRIVWITMLARMGPDYVVRASVGGLAHLARVSREECEKALEKLQNPDPDSRSTEYEGRRIRKVEGGFYIINGEKFRIRRGDEERREYMREYMRKYRSKQSVNNVKQNKEMLAQAEEEAEEEAEASLPPNPQEGNMFKSPTQKQVEEVYSHYPRKQGRKAALAKIAAAIKRHGLEVVLKATIDYAKARKGMEQQYTPIPATWYGQERYLDDPSTWAISSRKKTWKDLEAEADHSIDTEF